MQTRVINVCVVWMCSVGLKVGFGSTILPGKLSYKEICVYIIYWSMTTYNAGVCRFCFMQCYECSSVCTPYFTSPPMTAHHISVFVCTPESCISPFCVDLQPPLPAYLISVSVCTLKCLYVPSVCLFAMLNTAYIVLYLSADAHYTYIANFSLCLIGILL